MTTFYERLARYYDFMYAQKNYKDEAGKLHALIQQYKTSEGNRLLDVCCGTGGHLVHLRDYYDTTGFDISAPMLAVAKEKLTNVPLIKGNMVTLDLGQRFDIVTCLFGSINYLTTKRDLTKTIAAFAKHTNPGGVVILEPLFIKETFTPDYLSMLCVDQPDFKLARFNRTRRAGDIVYLDFHFLLTTKTGTEHFIDPSLTGLFSQTEFKTIMEHHQLTFTPIDPGISRKNLYLGVKAD